MENTYSKIGVDLQYQTLYQEMRRYRNAILAIGGWYSTLLITLAFISKLLINWLTSFGIWSLCFLLGITTIGICYLLWFDHIIYVELRDWIKQSKIEPLDRWGKRKTLPIKPPLVFTIIIAGFTLFLVIQLVT